MSSIPLNLRNLFATHLQWLWSTSTQSASISIFSIDSRLESSIPILLEALRKVDGGSVSNRAYYKELALGHGVEILTTKQHTFAGYVKGANRKCAVHPREAEFHRLYKDGLIFVLDAIDTVEQELALAEFALVCEQDEFEGTPLLVLLVDTPGPVNHFVPEVLTRQDVERLVQEKTCPWRTIFFNYPLGQGKYDKPKKEKVVIVEGRKCRVQLCRLDSNNAGLREGLKWLDDILKEPKDGMNVLH